MNRNSASEIDLRIYFAGLAAFVDRDDKMRVLLPDATERSSFEFDGRTLVAEPHYAVLQFDRRDLVGNPRPFGEFTDPFGQPKGYWRLDRDHFDLDGLGGLLDEELAIKRSAPNGHGRGAGRPAEEPLRIPSAEDARHIEWIAPLNGRGGAKPSYKDKILDPVGHQAETRDLAASFHFSRGRLQPAAFASEQGAFAIGEFTGYGRQALASVVEYRARIAAPSLCLTATKFNNSAGETLELSPAPHNESRLEIWVVNRGWEGIVRHKPPQRLEDGVPNADYLFFGKLLKNGVNQESANDLPRAVDRVRVADLEPSLDEPCRDPAMRRFYFPAVSGGELINVTPCSPTHG